MKIILHGCTGKMGHMMIDLLKDSRTDEIVAKAAQDGEEKDGCIKLLDAYSGEADVVIDFSNHAATDTLLAYCMKRELPVVICTTGQTEAEKQSIKDASAVIPVFYSANMSLGIAVLCDLAKRTASFFPDADIEIVEKHHNQKLDVPSGTALLLADAIKEVREDAVYNIGRHENGKRTKQEIGIHSLRMGTEVGTHEIYIHNGSECITLTHEAESRAVFAQGAVKAAEFIIKQKPGLYNMHDLVGD